jgi:hypothetical protein
VAIKLKDVEIKISLDADHVDQARIRFDLPTTKANEAEIWFCDKLHGSGSNARLQLLEADLIVRLRRKEDDPDDSTVKLRGPELRPPRGWDRADDHSKFKLEGDWSGPSQTVSASVVAEVEQGLIGEVAPGRPLDDRLFTPAQRRLVAAVLKPVELPLSTLQPLGPIQALQWRKEEKEGFRHEVAAEEWKVGNELRFLELSIRVPLEEALQSQIDFTDWVATPALAGTKTKIVLDHFARRTS